MKTTTDLLTYIAARRGGGSGGSRPAPRKFAPIAPPFDASMGGNIVHTALPPEQHIPLFQSDPLFITADVWGVTFTGDYFPKPIRLPDGTWDSGPIIEAGGTRMTSGPWKGTWIPFLKEQDSTPPTMLETPALIYYPREIADMHLTEHCWRNYQDFVISPEPWGAEENGFHYTPESILAWCRYVKERYKFRIIVWRGDPRNELDRMFRTLFDGGVVDFYIHGKEVDEYGFYGLTAEQYEASLGRMVDFVQGRVPIGVHFTANQQRHMGYPIGAPREYFIPNWSRWNGLVHLMQQLDVDADEGLKGAAMYYGRRQVMGMGDAAVPQGTGGAPESRVYQFETDATNKLYGKCTEPQAQRHSWQLFCGTRDDASIPPVGGTCEGILYPDGTPFQVPPGQHLEDIAS